MTNKDNWGVGETYEAYMGRWSRIVAREFVEWLGVPVGAAWLDIGCGTGALTETVLQTAQPSEITGVDLTEAYINFAQAHVTDPRASFAVGTAEDLTAYAGSADAIVSGLALNFVPDKAKAVGEMARAGRPGGMVAAYVWDYADQMQMLRVFWDAAVAINPAAKGLDEGLRFPICREDALRKLFEDAGLGSVETRAIDAPIRFENFDDYWTPFLSGQAPAPSYAMSLSEADREALREGIRARLAAKPDASIGLVARAWAVRGLVKSDTIKA